VDCSRPTTMIIALLICGFMIGTTAFSGVAATEGKVGSLTGAVIDAETQAPIVGATVSVIDYDRGVATDDKGRFRIDRLAVGDYRIRISSIGYTPLLITDIVIRSGRSSQVEAKLQMSTTEISGMTVTGDYFTDLSTQPTSMTSYSNEEIRRAPGSAGDVSRIMFSLPSIAKVNDLLNNLIVRGGSPTENSFYLDNIEIPNINHYQLFGTTGGPISLLNTDFIQEVEFSAGGFSSAFGDRLSSVMELTFREGNREATDLQAEISVAGFGFAGEGPIGKETGSWMVSVRRSYLDLLADVLDVGAIPRYSDYQGKIVLDLSNRHRLSFLGVVGIDNIEFDNDSEFATENIELGESDGYEYAAGVNWRYLWGRNGYSNTSLSFLGTRVRENYYSTSGERTDWRNDLDGSAQLRNVNFYRIADRHELEFGFDFKYELDSYNEYADEAYDFFGQVIPPKYVDFNVRSPKVGVFASYITQLTRRLRVTLGGRADYYKYTNNRSFSPRLALHYRLTPTSSFTGAFGIYYQTLPSVFLSQQERNKELNDPKAYHYVLGFQKNLREDTRLTIEGYYKRYDNFPLDRTQPQLFIIDEVIYDVYTDYHPHLVGGGKARSYGIEMTLQKKLRAGLYGLIGASWFRSQYRDLKEIWRDRSFDNRILVSVEGGYKPNKKWEFSLRWLFAGGAPYTPLDLNLSGLWNASVHDYSRVNESRYPDYHSLNVRVDRRFNFASSNMIVYVSVWNIYNRKNVALYYWDDGKKEPDVLHQWSILPIFGLKFEF